MEGLGTASCRQATDIRNSTDSAGLRVEHGYKPAASDGGRLRLCDSLALGHGYPNLEGTSLANLAGQPHASAKHLHQVLDN